MTSLQVLYDQYMTLSRKYGHLAKKCMDDDPDVQHRRLEQLQDDYRQAYKNYQAALNSVFQDNDPQLTKLKVDIQDAQSAIESMLRRIRSIDDVLNAISGAIDLASRLLSLGKPR